MAATVHGWRMQVTRRRNMPADRPTFELSFEEDPSIIADPLAEAIARGSVQRRPMRMQPLRTQQKHELAIAVGPGYGLVWFEGLRSKKRMAQLLFRSAKPRLTMPEAYRVHRDVIEWGSASSADKISDQALGGARQPGSHALRDAKLAARAVLQSQPGRNLAAPTRDGLLARNRLRGPLRA